MFTITEPSCNAVEMILIPPVPGSAPNFTGGVGYDLREVVAEQLLNELFRVHSAKKAPIVLTTSSLQFHDDMVLATPVLPAHGPAVVEHASLLRKGVLQQPDSQWLWITHQLRDHRTQPSAYPSVLSPHAAAARVRASFRVAKDADL
jgi:hypothetical protein